MEETKKCKYCQSDIPKKAKICPNCRKKQGGKGKVVLIVFAVIVIGAIIGSLGNSDDSEKNNAQVTPGAENVEHNYTLCDVDTMKDLLKSNALKAEKTYKDQYLEVTGKLSVIDSSGKYFSLNPLNDEWAITGITCYLKNNEQRDYLAELSTGDTLTVRVKCTSVGEVFGYYGDLIEFVK